MNSPIKPLKKKIVAVPIEDKKENAAGLIVVAENKERPVKAEVLAVGPEVMGLKPGDVILFAKYAPHEVLVGEKSYFVLQLDDILGILL